MFGFPVTQSTYLQWNYPCDHQIKTKYVRIALKINQNEKSISKWIFLFHFTDCCSFFFFTLSFFFCRFSISVISQETKCNDKFVQFYASFYIFQLGCWICYCLGRIQQKKKEMDDIFCCCCRFIHKWFHFKSKWIWILNAIYFEMKFEHMNKCKASKFAFQFIWHKDMNRCIKWNAFNKGWKIKSPTENSIYILLELCYNCLNNWSHAMMIQENRAVVLFQFFLFAKLEHYPNIFRIISCKYEYQIF